MRKPYGSNAGLFVSVVTTLTGIKSRLMKKATTTKAMTRKTTISALILSLVMMSILPVTPALGYRLFPNKWPPSKKSFLVCVDGSLPQFKQDQIYTFLHDSNPWAGKSQATWIVTEDNCFFHVFYDIVVTQGHIGPPATTGRSLNGSGQIVQSVIYFNQDHLSDFYWGNGVQDCKVGIGDGCEMDAKTIAIHEFGHALGIDHNTNDTVQRCDAFYDSDAAAQACTLTGTAVMHWNAGAEFLNNYFQGGAENQGYRHPFLKPDDKDAIVALFGAP